MLIGELVKSLILVLLSKENQITGVVTDSFRVVYVLIKTLVEKRLIEAAEGEVFFVTIYQLCSYQKVDWFVTVCRLNDF